MSSLSKEDILLANKIADRIKYLRIKDSGVKQIDFANKYNIDRQAINRWESHISFDAKGNKRSWRQYLHS